MDAGDRPSAKDLTSLAFDAPWIGRQAVRALIMAPYHRLLLRLSGVELGSNAMLYGRPIVQRYRGSRIKVGRNFESRNYAAANAVGCSHPLVLATRSRRAQILIGDKVGITGGVICAAESVEIGDECLIGADVLIVDTDFHPIAPERRRYRRDAIATSPVSIGRNVFIGARAVLLKGTTIGDNCVIGAGSIVAGYVPDNVVVAGNPARVIRMVS